jgi:hypothetical protein
MNAEQMTLYSGATKGAEEEFGRVAETYGIQEVNFSFEAHPNARTRGLHELSRDELMKGDVSLAYVSRLLNRNYIHKGETFRRVLQTLFHIINNSQEVFVVGEVLDDMTVKGGTGWGTEFAKLCNKRIFVFDQNKSGWYHWGQNRWERVPDDRPPVIAESHFSGLGTRYLKENGRLAIAALYRRTMVQ